MTRGSQHDTISMKLLLLALTAGALCCLVCLTSSAEEVSAPASIAGDGMLANNTPPPAGVAPNGTPPGGASPSGTAPGGTMPETALRAPRPAT